MQTENISPHDSRFEAAAAEGRANPDRPRPGDTLGNGALVIAIREGRRPVVLAHWNEEYVTWHYLDSGHCEAGHYFPYWQGSSRTQVESLTEAVEDLSTR